MSTSTTPRDGLGAAAANHSSTNGINTNRDERRSTETKASFKTTEFIAYVAVLAGILIAGLMVDDGPGSFGAEKVWLFATILTVGYMVSRGLAKAGSSDHYTHDADGN